MFNKKVPNFIDFINEALTISYWRNYKTDSPVDVDKETNDVSIQIMQMFGVDSQDKLMYVASDTGFGADYLFFYDIVKALSAEEQRTLNLPGYIVYINYYIDPKTDKPIALVNSKMNDGAMNSYIFIKTEDFKEFDPDAISNTDSGEDSDEGGDEGGEDQCGGGQPQGGGQAQGGQMEI